MIMIRHDRIRSHINGKYLGLPDDHFFKPTAAMFVTLLSNEIDIQKINQRTIDKIEKLINNRPRKYLDYKTPLEVYNELYGALTT
jgi:hypothetical protein